MGAHLRFKVVDPEQASKANQFLREQPEHEQLEKSESQILHFAETDEYYAVDVGEGSVKDRTESKPSLWADLFEKLHNHDDIEVKVLASSCALRLMTFSMDELNKVTNHGQALSGDDAAEYKWMIEKVNKLDSFPTPFVQEASQLENIPGDLTEDQLTILDVFLTFHMETLRTDMIAEYTPLSKQDFALPITELVNDDILINSYDTFYRLNPESETVHALIKLYDQTVE